MPNNLQRIAEDSARGGVFLIAGNITATIISAIAAIIVARLLGPPLYGQYTLSLTIPQMLFLFTNLGIDQGLTKFSASLRAKGETAKLTKIIRHGMLLKAIAGITIFLITFIFADFLASTLLNRPELSFYIRIASTSIIFQVILTTATSAFVGLDKTEYIALTANIQATAKTIVSLSLVLFGFSVFGAIIGHIAGSIISSVVGLSILLLMLNKYAVNGNGFSLPQSLKTLMKYGLPLYISVLLTGFLPQYQNVILAIFTSDVDIGNFKAAANFMTLITIFSSSIMTVLLPAFSKLENSNKETNMFFEFAHKYTVLLIVPITTLIILFAKEIVQIIYGSTYQSAAYFLSIYSTLYLLVGIGYLTLQSLFNGLGETKTTLKISLIAFAIFFLLSPLFTSIYNVPGSIIALIIANTAGTYYGLHVARNHFKMKLNVKSLTKIYLITAISAVPPLLLIQTHIFSAVFNLIIGGALFLLIYATLIPLSKIINYSELKAVKDILRKIKIMNLVVMPLLKYEENLLRLLKAV